MNSIQKTTVVMLLMTSLPVCADVLTGTQQTMTRNLMVQGTAEATVSITSKGNVLAGNASGGLLLGTFQASTTGGTIAYRLNPTIVEQYPTPSYGSGYIKNTSNQSQKIEVSLLNTSCRANGVLIGNTTTLIGQWKVCPESSDSVSGNIVTHPSKVQNIAGGIYPIAIDAVAWSF